MKATRILAALLLGAVSVLPFAAHAQKTGRAQLVIQVSEDNPAQWNLALNNAENVQEAFGKGNVDIEIVAYGPGLKMFLAESKVAPRLNKALDSNVGLMACASTMRKMQVTKADLIGGSTIVPGGVIRIMERQKQGWSYVRP